MNVLGPARSFALEQSEYLQGIDYRLASDEADRSEIFRLRYRAYLREKSILPNKTGQLSDDYDNMDNCWIFGLWGEDGLLSSIRMHILSRAQFYGPALDVFPDIVRPIVLRGALVVDPTRLVVDREAALRHRHLPHMTVRLACMASEHFGAEYCLATVRAEHVAFYRRLFSFEQVCEPRPYPALTKPICLMLGDMARIRDWVAVHHPMFTSTPAERHLLFERPRYEHAAPWQQPAGVEPDKSDRDLSDPRGASADESKVLN